MNLKANWFKEEYKEYISQFTDVWQNNFNELKDFIYINKKLPLQSTSIGKWLSHQQRNYKTKTRSMSNNEIYNTWKDFLEKHSEYFPTKDNIWNNKLLMLQEFIDKNKKRPSSNSKCENEKELANFIFVQLKSINDNKMADDRLILWNKFLKEYGKYIVSKNNLQNIWLDKWYKNLNEVILFVTKHKKRPSKESINKTEKQLGQWFGKQANDYKNKKNG